jgi:DNA-binding NtrC family response regulator
MNTAADAQQLVHVALQPLEGERLSEARLLDRERIAVVLQGAALLSHLEIAGWHLVEDWNEARIVDRALRVAVSPGRAENGAREALRQLLTILFGSEIAGRGEARRVARALLARWQQWVGAAPADDLVAEVLHAAPFLWSARFAAARRALAGEHRRQEVTTVWIAGPGEFRRRVSERCKTRGEAEDFLGTDDARGLWEARRPPRGGAGAAHALAHAEHLRHQGLVLRAARALEDDGAVAARLLRARCLLEAGELQASQRALEGLHCAAGSPGFAEWIDLRSAVAAENGDPVAMDLPSLRAAAAQLGGDSEADSAAWLAVACAAARTGDIAFALRCLVMAEERHGRCWRSARAAGEIAARCDRDVDVATCWTEALRRGRREMTRIEAASGWIGLGEARLRLGNLGRAEAAFRHAVRLLRTCEAPSRERWAAGRWIEARLRRGETRGAEESLAVWARWAAAQSGPEWTRRATALSMRLDLAQGRAFAALDRCEAYLHGRGARRGAAQSPELLVLAARALGWLGRASEAAEKLSTLAAPTIAAVLEPEEAPALWALAGQREAAFAAASSPCAALWRGALTQGVDPASWSLLRGLDRYRAARLAFDLELVAPGTVPVYWKRRAAAALRRAGAGLSAERLEGSEGATWAAIERYVLSDEADSPVLLRQAVYEAGYPEVRLAIESGDGERVLVPGPGGGDELRSRIDGGELTLRAPLIDSPLRAFFALVARRLAHEGRRETAPRPAPASVVPGLIGESAAVRAAIARTESLARGEMPVLVLGETGTGKELIAKAVHGASRRASGPYLAINCAALSETLLVADLFGHVRGAFTGAERDRAGVFEAAKGGTVFLDEIGDLPLVAQGMLLRVLQEREVRRVGESVARGVDVRVLAATHRDLPKMVREGTFRADLYFRLAVALVDLPPLRERGDDAVLIATHWLASHAPGLRLSARARAMLLAHSWPGNVRELENTLAVASALARGSVIESRHLEIPNLPGGTRGDYHLRVEAYRRRLIEEALEATGGNRAEAARRLGLSRQALSYLSQQMGFGRRR